MLLLHAGLHSIPHAAASAAATSPSFDVTATTMFFSGMNTTSAYHIVFDPVVPVHRVWDVLAGILPDPAACIMAELRCVQQFVSLGGEKFTPAKFAA